MWTSDPKRLQTQGLRVWYTYNSKFEDHTFPQKKVLNQHMEKVWTESSSLITTDVRSGPKYTE